MINYKKHITTGCFNTKGNRTQQFLNKYKTDEITDPLQSKPFVKLLCKDLLKYVELIDNDEFKIGSDKIIAALDISDKYFGAILSNKIKSIYVDPILKTLIYFIVSDSMTETIKECINDRVVESAFKIINDVNLSNIINYNLDALLIYMTEFIKEEVREYEINEEPGHIKSKKKYTVTIQDITVEDAQMILLNGIKGTSALKQIYGYRHDMQLYRMLDALFVEGRVRKFIYMHDDRNKVKRLARYYIHDFAIIDEKDY